MKTVEELTVSHSQLQQWDRCRFAFKLSYIDGWQSIETKTYFQLGSLVHEFLELHYENLKNGGDHGESMARIVESARTKLENNSGMDQVDLTRRALKLMENYVMYFSPIFDEKWQVLATEYHFKIPLKTPSGVLFFLQGFVDLVAKERETGRVYIWDHKTTGNAAFWSDTEAMMDPQLPIYIAGLQEIGKPIHGAMLNFINTYDYKKEADLDKQFKRMKVYKNENELSNILYEVGLKVDDILANKDNPLRSLRKDCSQCRFQAPCLLSLKGVPIQDAMEGGFGKNGQEGSRENRYTVQSVDDWS